jgi:hypothetical protein
MQISVGKLKSKVLSEEIVPVLQVGPFADLGKVHFSFAILLSDAESRMVDPCILPPPAATLHILRLIGAWPIGLLQYFRSSAGMLFSHLPNKQRN